MALFGTCLTGCQAGHKTLAATPASAQPTSTVAPRPALPCFVNDGTPAGSAISLGLAPSRATGVAPLSVYFDTEGTTASASTLPFHELGYCWDFGDSKAGNFTTTGLSRNQARGPSAAHVFETPGTYTVAVSARDSQGRVATQSVQITVQDPEQVYAGSNTICFSPSGAYDGCPSGAQQVKTSLLSGLQSYIAANRRLLLHRGETFTWDNGLDVSAGPGTVGAFGTGAAPLVTGGQGGSTYAFGASGKSGDWRIMDLSVQGSGSEAALWIGDNSSNLLALRVVGTNVGSGFMTAEADLPAIVDCEFHGTGNAAATIYALVHRGIFLGNTLRSITADNGKHVVRLPLADQSILEDNDFADTQAQSHLLKIHGPHAESSDGTALPWTTSTGYSERVVVADNIFHGNGSIIWMVNIAPQNAQFDERMRDIIVDGNFFLADGVNVQTALNVWSTQNATIRNNIVAGSSSSFSMAIAVGAEDASNTAQTHSQHITVLNNTCHQPNYKGFICIVADGVSDVSIHNNLTSGAKNLTAVSVGVADQVVQDHNLATDAPGYASSSPTQWADFALTSGSAAVDTGDPSNMPFWDFSGSPRPIDGKATGTALPDIGALEYAP